MFLAIATAASIWFVCAALLLLLLARRETKPPWRSARRRYSRRRCELARGRDRAKHRQRTPAHQGRPMPWLFVTQRVDGI